MSEKAKNYILRSPMFRMSFPNVIEPRAYMGTGAKTFGVEMLLNPDDLGKFQLLTDEKDESGASIWEEVDVQKLMVKIAKDAWADINVKEAVKHGGLTWPLIDGDKKAADREAKGKKGDIYKGYKVLKASSNEEYAPSIHIIDGGVYRELDRNSESDMAIAKTRFVAGYYAKASLSCKAIETPQGKFIKFYMNAILFVKDGERIGGMSTADRFGGIEGGSSDYDPTEGMDDEIPF